MFGGVTVASRNSALSMAKVQLWRDRERLAKDQIEFYEVSLAASNRGWPERAGRQQLSRECLCQHLFAQVHLACTVARRASREECQELLPQIHAMLMTTPPGLCEVHCPAPCSALGSSALACASWSRLVSLQADPGAAAVSHASSSSTPMPRDSAAPPSAIDAPALVRADSAAAALRHADSPCPAPDDSAPRLSHPPSTSGPPALAPSTQPSHSGKERSALKIGRVAGNRSLHGGKRTGVVSLAAQSGNRSSDASALAGHASAANPSQGVSVLL